MANGPIDNRCETGPYPGLGVRFSPPNSRPVSACYSDAASGASPSVQPNWPLFSSCFTGSTGSDSTNNSSRQQLSYLLHRVKVVAVSRIAAVWRQVQRL